MNWCPLYYLVLWPWGEGREDSDMDILIIVNEESIELRRNLIGIGFNIQLETGVDLSIKVVSEDEYNAHENFSFFKTIASACVPIVP